MNNFIEMFNETKSCSEKLYLKNNIYIYNINLSAIDCPILLFIIFPSDFFFNNSVL